MRVFIDVTSACRSPQNTGMQRMTRKIFAELNVRFDVRPISWNKVGNIYTELGEQEFRFLTRPFESRSHGAARPEWRGEDPLTELYRMLRRRRVNLEKEIGADNVFLVPDIFRDRRREALPVFLKQTGARVTFGKNTVVTLPTPVSSHGRASLKVQKRPPIAIRPVISFSM